jgi:type IV secretion system protein VirB9
MRARLLVSLAAAALATALTAAPALADQPTSASKYDGRIRFATYNNADVLTIDTMAGIATHIQLEEGEAYVTHAFGDAAAWSFAMERNHVFLKPKAEKADTNLVIVTDKRTYNFRLRYHNKDTDPVVYQLSFYYPESQTKATATTNVKDVVEKGFKVPTGRANTDYTMAGDRSIAPINVWDDGKFTYFKFPEYRDLPAIYIVDADGRESMVNRNTAGEANDIIVAQKVNEKWRVRLGDQVLSVFNEKMIAERDAPIATNRSDVTGTRSPAVARVIAPGASQ